MNLFSVCNPLFPTSQNVYYWIFSSKHSGNAQLPQWSHLKNQHANVRHGQTEIGSLSVLRRVQTDAVHLQPPGDLQQLVVRLRGSLPAAGRE